MNAETPTKLRARATGILMAAILAALALGSVARADSLWDQRNPRSAFLYTDNVASEVGDLLTVLIVDESSFTKKGKKDLSKEDSHTSAATLTTAGVDMFKPIDLSEASSRKFQSSDQYTGSMKFADSITVTVVDKLPNGNMVVAGRSQRAIAGEEVVTVLTGIVEPEYVSGTNTVPSSRLANLRIYYETTGVSNAYMRQGILNRILNFLWPF